MKKLPRAPNPTVGVFVLDANCFPKARFPASEADGPGVKAFARSLVAAFSGSPLMAGPQKSVTASMMQGHLLLELAGSSNVDVSDGKRATMFTSFVITEAKDNYWMVWWFMSDSQAGLDELKNTKITFTELRDLP